MERVIDHGKWSLIDPATDPRLAETHGKEFEDIYLKLEAEGKVVQTIDAEELWHRLLTKIFQHGTFWPCFKDEVNARYSQRQSGIVHHSNLCLTGDTRVVVSRDGVLVEETIKDLVGNFHGTLVKSYNTKTKTTEFKPVTNGALMKKKTRVMRITDSETGRSIRCTPEHKVWTANRGYVEAQHLKVTDTLNIG
jgi:ribonucleoside-diphosphate reductase alpha chain